MITSSRTQLRLIWYAMAFAVLAIGLALQMRWLPMSLRGMVANRWFLFTEFGLLSAYPVYLWRKFVSVVLSMAATAVILAVNTTAVFVPQYKTEQHIIGPEVLGVAAGVLLGLNLRGVRQRSSRPQPSL